MTHLIPTVITDVNGKTTTVHKRDTAVSKGTKQLPAPALTKAGHKPSTGKLLPVPPAISKEDADEFLRRGGVDLGPRVSRAKSEITTRQSGLDTVALVSEMLRSGRISSEDASYVMDDKITLVDCYATYNTLLMFEHLKTGDQRFINDDRMLIVQAMQGMAVNNSKFQLPLPKFTTEDELVRYGAIIRFICVQDWTKDLVGRTDVPINDNTTAYAYALNNKHLDRLIQDYPDDVRRINTYITERGMDKRKKAPVEALRIWLDETRNTTAISEGWL